MRRGNYQGKGHGRACPTTLCRELNRSICRLGCGIANVPMRVHWRHLANTIELVPPSANPSTQPIRQIDRFSHFCTAHGRMSPGMPGHLLSPNSCLFPWGSGTHIINASLSSPESITQTASRSVQPFLYSSRQNVVGHVGACPSLSKLPLPMRYLYPI